MSHTAPIRRQFTGSGRAILREHQDSSGSGIRNCTFTELSFSFPLKLISPRISSRNATVRRSGPPETREGATSPVAALYVVGYGGGLVSGDTVHLDLDVGTGCTLLLLTQGSTKVFKLRSPSLLGTPSHSFQQQEELATRQIMRCIVRPQATLVLLPDPVTCFARSRYIQTQRFDLRSRASSSLVLLDWITAGRTALGTGSENWAFERYKSRNEVRVQGEIVAHDVLLLEQELPTSDSELPQASQLAQDQHPSQNADMAPISELARRNAPYACYATLLLIGPATRETVSHLTAAYHQIQQRTTTRPPPIIWSFSKLVPDSAVDPNTGAGEAAVLRVAGIETEMVREWLRENLKMLRAVVGDDLYRQALG